MGGWIENIWQGYYILRRGIADFVNGEREQGRKLTQEKNDRFLEILGIGQKEESAEGVVIVLQP